MFNLKELEAAVAYLKSKDITYYSVKSDNIKYLQLDTDKYTITLFDDNASTLKIAPTVKITEELK
jgi:hypothetical protein